MILGPIVLYLLAGIGFAVFVNIPEYLRNMTAYALRPLYMRWITVTLFYLILIGGWLPLVFIALRRSSLGGDIDS